MSFVVEQAVSCVRPTGACTLLTASVAERRSDPSAATDRAGDPALELRTHASDVHGRDRLALLVVGTVSALVVLVPVGFKMVDDVLDLDGCDGPSDWEAGVGDGTGSCARPFAGTDVIGGDVGFELQAHVGGDGWVATSYRVTNHTSEWRSIDSSKVEVVGSRGRTIKCSSDDSAVMVSSGPQSTQTRSCGGVPDGHGGVYELVYDDATVHSVDLRG